MNLARERWERILDLTLGQELGQRVAVNRWRDGRAVIAAIGPAGQRAHLVAHTAPTARGLEERRLAMSLPSIVTAQRRILLHVAPRAAIPLAIGPLATIPRRAGQREASP